nr:MAG TPA: alpha-aminoadipate carrier protein [Caudoviricetes sp.]
MTAIKFNEFVENNFNANRVEELRGGTSILTGFKNFQEIEELAREFKDDEAFIEVAEFKNGNRVGKAFAPFKLYTKALNDEFCKGMRVEEVSEDKFSVTCEGCNEPFAVYDKESVDYEFDGTTHEIGIVFKTLEY